MVNWIVEQFMKVAAGTALAGILWVLLVGMLTMTIPFWVLWVASVLIVYGVVFFLEHGDGHWDIF